MEKRLREEAMAEGKAEGKVEDIIELLEEIGIIPEELKKRMQEQKDLGILRKWHKLAARSGSIEEFEGRISECAEAGSQS